MSEGSAGGGGYGGREEVLGAMDVYYISLTLDEEQFYCFRCCKASKLSH